MDKNQKNPNFIDKRYELVHKEMVLVFFFQNTFFQGFIFTCLLILFRHKSIV